MNLPRFTAESSLYSTSVNYFGGGALLQGKSIVQPALFTCRDCVDICEGDLIGACMPWCLCRCHGGKHCGFPS